MEYRLSNYALVAVVLTPDLSGEMEQEYVFVGSKVNGMDFTKPYQNPSPVTQIPQLAENRVIFRKCSWHCKHKKPVSRCIISFDPQGKYRMQFLDRRTGDHGKQNFKRRKMNECPIG